mgnify:FL=1
MQTPIHVEPSYQYYTIFDIFCDSSSAKPNHSLARYKQGRTSSKLQPSHLVTLTYPSDGSRDMYEGMHNELRQSWP